MVAQDRPGKIINLASQAGRRGEGLVTAYCATKAAVINITQSTALALAPHRINVNAIAPGVIDTPMWERVDAQFAKYEGLAMREEAPGGQGRSAWPHGHARRFPRHCRVSCV